MKYPLACGILLAITAADAQMLEFRPAHWVEDRDALRPQAPAFRFRDMAFRSADDGWILGDLFVLHLRDDAVEVAFVDQGGWRPSQVLFTPAGDGWMVVRGRRGQSDHLLRDGPGGWTVQDLPARYEQGEALYRLQFLHPDALHLFVTPYEHPGEDAPFAFEARDQDVLRFTGSEWRYDADPLLVNGQMYSGSCQLPDGTSWRVGGQRVSPGHVRGLAMRQVDGRWSEVALPDIDERIVFLTPPSCLSDGAVVVGVAARNEPARPSSTRILRYADGWEWIPVPEEIAHEHTGHLVAPRPGEIWFVAQCSDFIRTCPAHFWHWVDGHWTEEAPPYLPGGRRTAYFLNDLQFPSPDEGWAIASDLGSRPGRGLIFHYRDGMWRNRNWDWHFWHQPGFGLFGY